MPYVKTNWIAGATPLSQGNMNNLETQWDEAAYATSGSYAGDDSANRPIAHGLGVTPKIVFIQQAVAGVPYLHNLLAPGKLSYVGNEAGTVVQGTYDVTVMDATNFYVGNAANYARSANAAGLTYYWIAIK